MTISFDIHEVEKADEVRVSFKDDKKEYYVLKAPKPWVYGVPQYPGVSLILGEGRVSVIIQNISVSRSGNYTARVFIRENVSEETATLLVNKAPRQFPPLHLLHTPPQAQTPPHSADHRGRYGLIPVFIIFTIIIIILSVCFWKHRMIPCFKRETELETSSSDRVSVNMNGCVSVNMNGCVSVNMNGCGENTEAPLMDTRVSYNMK